MDTPVSIPTWSELFSLPDNKEADEGRSINSPAAYLADLLRLLEDRFDPSDFRSRRPDITSRILLNGDQSFTAERQLDSANHVMSDRVETQKGSPADDVLAAAQHPFSLPFEYQHERIRQQLRLLRTQYRDLYAGFAPRPDVDVLARERLGLSPARAETIVRDLTHDVVGLSAAYGLAPNETLSSLEPLGRFRQATGLDEPTLRQLLFANLSQAATSGGTSERDAAGQLFVSHDLGGFVTLDTDEQRLVWHGEADGIPAAWFDRVRRLLCLSRWTGVDLLSVDLVLRQLCQNTLDLSALRRLAVVVDLRARTGAAVDLLCSLLGELDAGAALGAGDDPDQPASLFDRTFNGEAARLAKRYVPSGSDHLPPPFVNWPTLVATGDVLLDVADNRELRARVQSALSMSAPDLAALVTRFRDRALSRGRSTHLTAISSRSLSILHRVVRLADLVDLAPADVLTLVDVIESDPAVRVMNAFDLLHHEDTDSADLYQVLEDGPVAARSWLIQNIIAVAAWAGTAGLAPADLTAIAAVVPSSAVPTPVVPAPTAPAPIAPDAAAGQLATAQALLAAFLPTALTAAALQSGDISERIARIALASIGEPARHLVSAADARLINWDEGRGREAVYAALAALDVVSVGDIAALRLGDELATYLQSLLIRHGSLDANGLLQVDQLPTRAEDLLLESDGSARFAAIFDFLHGLYQTAADAMADGRAQADAAGADPTLADDGTAADAGTADTASTETGATDPASADSAAQVEIHLFPSDLLKLGFDISEADEWIERMTCLRVLDSTGLVQDATLFADPANGDAIPINIGLDAFQSQIYAELAVRRDRWTSASLTLPNDIWDKLPLSVAERDELEQNLIFNNHISADRRIVDKKILATLTPDGFDLELPFSSQRQAILDALLAFVQTSRSDFLTVEPDDLRPLADTIVGTNIYNALSASYLDDQARLGEEILGQIDHDQPPIDLGPAYSTAQQQQVWALLQQINAESSKYRLTDAMLATVGIAGEHATEVVVSLSADGYIGPDGTLSPEQVAWFLAFNNVQDFSIAQYADYARDVFLVIHNVAGAVDGAAQALMATLTATASAQEAAVLQTLSAQIGLSPDATAAVIRPLLRGASVVADLLMTPVFRAAAGDHIDQPPLERSFCDILTRAQAFANFAVKLRMTPREIEAAFEDQQLVDKFREDIMLPQGVDAIDALWAGPGGHASGLTTFTRGDFLDLDGFAEKLQQRARLIDAWLAEQLGDPTSAALEAYGEDGAGAESLETLLLQDLNRIIQSALIHDSRRFAGVALRPKTRKLILWAQQATDLRHVNRLLIEDAYPQELVRNQLYLFRGPHYWTYDVATLELDDGPIPLETLSPEFKSVGEVDAVYTLPSGEHWLLANANAWRRAADSAHWAKVVPDPAGQWGRVRNSFDDPASIDGALLDRDGRIHLFAGDQYIRYSSWPQIAVDEGYPRRISNQWSNELDTGSLPASWDSGIDAAVTRKDDVTLLFKDDRYVTSADPGVERSLLADWGVVRNNLAAAARVDAVLDVEGRCGVVTGDQVAVFSNSLEADGLTVDEGYPQTLSAVFPGLPEAFSHGIEAGLTDGGGTLHLFHDQDCAIRKDGKWAITRTRDRWGQVRNTLQDTGRVDAALAGLDGKVYLFSGDQYVCYSGADLSRIDEGYPRSIARDWGGLTGVDAALVLDGKTYLFGPDHRSYVRYSTRDYSKPDDGYPKETDDNWWNLPVALLKLDYHKPDAVFVAPDRSIHLFRGDQTISFDHNHRWWSEPVPVRQVFAGLPLTTISAAFTARDGRSYMFTTDGEPSFVRFSDSNFNRVDDRFPRPVREHWGRLANNIQRTGRVDAAVMVMTPPTEAGGKPVRYQYLFSGDQFYRYSRDEQPASDEGYPLRIQSGLRRESHFAHLDAPIERGVDGVWADGGNVFVFLSDQIHVASTTHCRQLDRLGVDDARAADAENGRLTVCGKADWRHIAPPEAYTRFEQPALPRVLRGAPPAFQGQLSTILRGLDQNVYLFASDHCYDISLGHQYQTGSAWGKVRNRIAEEERVDCALMGQDGKIYLFRDDQFVSYTPTREAPASIPDLVDLNPTSVAAHWGGLSNVRHAFIRRGVTYLSEAPAEDGAFRYIRYFGVDYTQPNEPSPLLGDFSFWNIPAEYIDRGFDRIDSVLSDGEELILIKGAQFLHYDGARDIWTSPRPLSLRWPGLPHHYPDFEVIRALLRGPDGRTYFFGDGSWLAHDGEHASELAAIGARWGLLRNRIAQSNRVDAALVFGDQTYLFSGDEYVRYTGNDYEYVDVGYPRAIAGLLRREAPFQQIPADIETAFEGLKPADIWVAAAYSTGGSVFVTIAGRTYALSRQLTRSYPIGQVARVRNELARRARVDGAFARADGAMFLLSGDQYVRYSRIELDVVDDGYPRPIGENLLAELSDHPPSLPLNFQYDLDAALLDNSGALLLFKGRQFIRFDPKAPGSELVPTPIKGVWGRVSNPFLPSASDPQPRIDAAFVAADHVLYVFKGDQYIRYTDPTAEFIDEGYPRAIRHQWGNLPDDFATGIDGAFVHDGRTYLCHEKRYVRFSDAGYTRIDPIYPQPFVNRWRISNDFLLGDLRTIQRFVAFDQSHPSADASLTDVLLALPHDNVDSYAVLAALFNVGMSDVQWLKRRDAFLDRPARERSAETRFDIALILRIADTLDLARRVGSHPQELYEQVWSRLYTNSADPAHAADTLERLLGTLYSGDDWIRIQRQLGDALSRLRRDALVAWLLVNDPVKLADVRSLSDLLLTDVEIDSSLDASPISEAIAAIQLYFHRYLINLEPAAAAGDDLARRAKFKAQWCWLQNYRVWEANRKVFLYPESYIRPELRATRTATFKSLQENLQQGEITNDSVLQAYRKYLDDYTEVSRLVIVGGYRQPDPQDPDSTELTLFGATRTDPRRYYYRTATFEKGDSSSTAVWQAWRALGIEINASRVYPVRAFGRTFVFWTEVEQNKPDGQTSTTLQVKTKGDVQEVSGPQQVEYTLKVMYSFCDLSDQWTSPQTLTYGPTETGPIQDTHLQVSRVGADEDEAIIVDFHCDLAPVERSLLAIGLSPAFSPLLMALPPRVRAKRLTADLTVSEVAAVPVLDARADMLLGLFDAAESSNLDLNAVIAIDSADRRDDAPWYSFDIKGGSFLARPAESRSSGGPEAPLLALANNADYLPRWNRVDACLNGSDGHQYSFNNERFVYAIRGDSNEYRINTRWGLRYTKVHADGQVDAAWQRGGVYFLLRGDRYVKYSRGLDWVDDEGERGSESERTQDGVPNWPAIDAAFTDKLNTTWFFRGGRYAGVDAAGRLGAEANIQDRWGHGPNEFTASAAGAPPILAAFTRDGRSYLIGPSTYTWYASPDLAVAEPPKPQSLRAVLEQLKCTNSADVDAAVTIAAAVDEGAELIFMTRGGAGNDEYSLVDGKVSTVKRAAGATPSDEVAGFVNAGKKFALTPKAGGVVLSVEGSEERREYPREIRAAMLAIDGNLYLFGPDRYLLVKSEEITMAGIGGALDQWPARSVPISDRWGKGTSAFPPGASVTAALVRGDHTFLVSNGSYVRYSDAECLLIDAGYPKPLAGNPDGLPATPFKAALEGPDGRVYFFTATQYVVGDALSAQIANQSRWGRIRSNILVRGVDTAYRVDSKVDSKHYLFSGNEVVSYTAGSDGKLPVYMDGAPVRAELGSFGAVRGVFAHNDLLYLVGRDSFICCKSESPEQPLPQYPRHGQAAALLADLCQQFHLPTNLSTNLPDSQEVYALSLQGDTLLLDTDDNVPGQRVLRFDLKYGLLSRDWGRSPVDWATLRRDGTAFVDLPKDRYSFRADQVIRTDRGVAAQWDTSRAIRSISAVWGGRPFDAAIDIGDDLLLFAADRFSRLAKSAAADNNGLSAVVTNLGNALARLTPIRGSITNLPSSFLDGFDAALSANGSLYLFKNDQYVRLSGHSLPQLVASLKYDIVRLTTSTAARLNRELFLGGVDRLLSLRTQEIADTPGFSATSSSPTTIHVNADRVNIDTLPPGDHLDFGSANGVYLWEIFFHGPALIADMLSTAQRFEEARAWYEHIFDPTEPADAWKFLPFLSEDVERIVLEIRDRLDRLEQAKVDVADLRRALTAPGEFGKLIAMAPKLPDLQTLTDQRKADLDRHSVLDVALAVNVAFQGERNLIDLEPAALDALTLLPAALAEPLKSVAERTEPDLKAIGAELRELVDLAASLRDRWDDMQTMQAQIKSYLDDPFDPHAIAALRPIAYRKAIVMRYLDNLLAWGDMLFSQYTRESITEARMLYVEAWDVLGRRPESLGRRILLPDAVYDALRDARPGEYDMLMQLEGSRTAQLSFAGSLLPTGSDVRAAPYFFIPPNDELDQYWTRVEDRLYKIRNGLNILGIQQPLALFEPPLDVMALVRAVAGAGGLAGLVDGAAGVDVPHYRFSFLIGKAQSLVQTVIQLGSELLGALEKRDAEAMMRLQTMQEGEIVALTLDMQKSQLAESQTNLESLQKGRDNAQKRRDVYQSWLDVGYLPMEDAQIGLLTGAVALNMAAGVMNTVAAVSALIPKVHIGLFTFGTDTPEFHQAIQYAGGALQSLAGGIQGIGDILGITAQHERSMQDWSLQRDLATIDMAQIDAQIEGAKWQIAAAQQQIAITERQIQHNKAVSDFYHSKFTNQELYEWMAGRLSEIHYQTYQLTLAMARAAERSFQFERGRKQADTSFIQGQQWDSQRRGLLAGYGLGLALNRMDAAYTATDARRFEITKTISLLQLDPMAFLKLKTDGVCEFDFGEALFDYDFPGHYCRQVKTIAVDLALGDGVFANATLTQLTSRVIMEPDAKAVGFLLAPKETPPLSIRSNWKAQQQIALSSHTQYETNSGMFELRFDSDRYLPFEGTGAVSRWRLELGGPPGAYDLGALTDVTITLKYTALQGGDAFAAAVRGLLKPTDVLRAFNLSVDFADAWQGFIGGDSDVLELPLTPANFPNMTGGAIRAIFARYEYQSTAQGTASFVIDMGVQLPLPDGKTVDTSGLTVRAAGTTLRLRVSGDKSSLRNAYLLMSYKGGVR